MKDAVTGDFVHPLASSHAIDSLRGLLCRYAQSIPIAANNVYSLFQLQTNNKQHVRITPHAARDIAFWRSVVLLYLQYPHLLGVSIHALRKDRRPKYFINTDACTGLGTGGTITTTPTWSPGQSSLFFVIRWWHPEERQSLSSLQLALVQKAHQLLKDPIKFEQITAGFQISDSGETSIHMNVLEFAGACCAFWLVIFTIADSLVDLGGDNTTTLCWMIKHKASNYVADRLLKILGLLCIRFRVQITDHKVPGKYFRQPDWLSRCTSLDYLDPPDTDIPSTDDEYFLLMKTGCHQNYNRLCRLVLHRCLTAHSFISFDELFKTVTAMANHAQFYRPPNEPLVVKLLDAIHIRYSRLDPPISIPSVSLAKTGLSSPSQHRLRRKRSKKRRLLPPPPASPN